jgi:hypothetical protein
VLNYVKKKPPIPDVWPVMQGTNLTQEEVDALTSTGFRIVARPDVIDEKSLPPQESPAARQEPPTMTTSQRPSWWWNCVVRERRIVTREHKHSMVRARALQVVHKGHFYMGMLEDLRVYTVQTPGAKGTGKIYHINIEPYPKCDCSDFARLESRRVKTYTPCKHMY